MIKIINANSSINIEGIDYISIVEFMKKARVSQKTVYNYFEFEKLDYKLFMNARLIPLNDKTLNLIKEIKAINKAKKTIN